MDFVSDWMAPFHPQFVLFGIATKRVVFGGCRFIFRNVTEGAPGSIMNEVNTIIVAEFVPLAPCISVVSGTGTSGYAAVAWELRGFTVWCNGGLVLLGRHCCHLLDELLDEYVGYGQRLVVGRLLAWCKYFSNEHSIVPLQLKIKETIVVVSECTNNGMDLVTRSAGGIAVVVVEVSQLLIVMLFKALILILGRGSGAVDNVPRFRNTLELFAMVFCTEC